MENGAVKTAFYSVDRVTDESVGSIPTLASLPAFMRVGGLFGVEIGRVIHASYPRFNHCCTCCRGVFLTMPFANRDEQLDAMRERYLQRYETERGFAASESQRKRAWYEANAERIKAKNLAAYHAKKKSQKKRR